jgi:hypothetical protein
MMRIIMALVLLTLMAVIPSEAQTLSNKFKGLLGTTNSPATSLGVDQIAAG